MSKNDISRRNFLAIAVSTTAGCATLRRAPAKLSTRNPNEKLNVAGIGVGGKGAGDVQCSDTENIVALCDVDDRAAARTFEAYPNARKYKDYRKMLDEMKEIDAVNVSTPDHMHFPCAMYAMALGKHVYVQKPLTHTVWEARQMAVAARKHRVHTQMGNQGHAGDPMRQLVEVIRDGAIGNVREVHCWTNRPIWPQGMAEPLPEQPVPESLDWELWLGVAPRRPYNGSYCPFNWRGWWDYGTGALGDMACHLLNAPNWALELDKTPPTRVEVVRQFGMTAQSPPTLSTIRYDFPAHGQRPAVTVYWYDGFEDPKRPKETPNLPPRPKEIPADVPLGRDNNGCIYIGDEGVIMTHTQGVNMRLFPADKFRDYRMPDETIPRMRFGDTPQLLENNDFQHHQDWIRAIKGGPAPMGNFAYSGPLTEFVLLGNIALRCGRPIEWDAKSFRITNVPEANALLTKDYPPGWLPA